MIDWLFDPVAEICQKSRDEANSRQQQLTKPLGSLGQLEQIAIDFCGWQHSAQPELSAPVIRVFAGDHGVVAEGVSAFPQEVTAQMVNNFGAGGAAITVLARQLEADFLAINLGTVVPADDYPNVVNLNLATSSENFLHAPAMSEQLFVRVLQAGREYAPQQGSLFIGGEMGIGNTTAAAALICAITGSQPEIVVGRGTGIDDDGLALKKEVVTKALARHCDKKHCATQQASLELLRCLGGLEIAALVASYISCAQRGIPSLVDGYIASAAALVACNINPGLRDWLSFSHQSAESGHQPVLNALGAKPLLNAGMRLGEGSGAALAVPVIQLALALHNQMATFEQAGVSDH